MNESAPTPNPPTTTEKANYVARVDVDPVEIPRDAVYLPHYGAGRADFDGGRGGIVISEGRYYCLAHEDAVPSTGGHLPEGHVSAHRWGRLSIKQVPNNQQGGAEYSAEPPTYGAELEVGEVDKKGFYAQNIPPRQLNELYRHMVEESTKPTDSPAELAQRYSDMVRGLVERAAARGNYIIPVSVFAQSLLSEEHCNPTPYIKDVMRRMTGHTGFDTAEVFAVAGAQYHVSVSDTTAAAVALEAMQPLNAILMAPSLAAPFISPALHNKLMNRTPQQRQHSKEAGISQERLSDPLLSWRYPLRRLGSMNAGIFRNSVTDTFPLQLYQYLSDVDFALATGSISNPDQVYGRHTDRLRTVLDQSGSSTAEFCADDTFLAHPRMLTAAHLLRGALFKSLEQDAIRGVDPRQRVARLLGTPGPERYHEGVSESLAVAHQASLASSRQGNDARLYGKTPQGWLPALLKIAAEAPSNPLTSEHQKTLRSMYQTRREVDSVVHGWYRRNSSNNIIDAYYATGVGCPAEYLRIQYKIIEEQYPRSKPEDIIRLCELAAGQALHRYVERTEKE